MFDWQGHAVSWLDARNLCRERCMDLVSLETPQENKMFVDLITQRNLREVRGGEEREEKSLIKIAKCRKKSQKTMELATPCSRFGLPAASATFTAATSHTCSRDT